MDQLARDGFVLLTQLNRCGIYAMLRNGEIAYIGKSRDVYTRVKYHFVIKSKGYDAAWVLFCEEWQLDMLEIRMINKHQPLDNVEHMTYGQIKINLAALGLRPPDPPRNPNGIRRRV